VDYTSYLPDIDVEDGKARVMGNLKLYFRLIGKFDGAKMAGAITAAIEAKNNKEVVQATHALRGTAANLGFPVVQKITSEIEALAKEEKDGSHLLGELDTAVAALSGAIGRLLESQ